MTAERPPWAKRWRWINESLLNSPVVTDSHGAGVGLSNDPVAVDRCTHYAISDSPRSFWRTLNGPLDVTKGYRSYRAVPVLYRIDFSGDSCLVSLGSLL